MHSSKNTVDGRHLHQLVDSIYMYLHLFRRLCTSHVVQDFLHQTYDPAILQLRTSHPHIAASPSPRLTDRDTADGDIFRGHRILAPRVSSWKPWYTTNLPKKRFWHFCWMPRFLAKFQDDVWNSLLGITVNLLLVNSQCWKKMCSVLSCLFLVELYNNPPKQRPTWTPKSLDINLHDNGGSWQES